MLIIQIKKKKCVFYVGKYCTLLTWHSKNCRRIFHPLNLRFFWLVCPVEPNNWPVQQSNGKIMWVKAIIKFLRSWGNGIIKQEVDRKLISCSVSALTVFNFGKNSKTCAWLICGFTVVTMRMTAFWDCFMEKSRNDNCSLTLGSSSKIKKPHLFFPFSCV